MSKLELFKVYTKYYISLFKKSFKLLGLLGKIFYNFLTKDYLNQYPLIENLEEAFSSIDLRARPLPKEMVESFEVHAFKQIDREGMEVDFIKNEHYNNPNTKELTNKWSFSDGATTIQEGHLTTLGDRNEQ